MKLGIIGNGMVGKAVENGFSANTILISDPTMKRGMSIETICKQTPDMIFVCVPTPIKHAKFDATIIDQVMETINSSYDGIVIIKSTVPPDIIEKLADSHANIKIAHNPEFLSDKTAMEDFINPSLIVIGCDDNNTALAINDLYLNHSNISCSHEIIHNTDLVTASLIKYGFNTFYATKVTFMNELYNIIHKSNTDFKWDEFKKIYGANQWIGKKHLDVPGHDGYFGFGGKCLPKDTKAFVEYASSINQPFELLEKVIELNENLRNE